jgi:hypothetical protein
MRYNHLGPNKGGQPWFNNNHYNNGNNGNKQLKRHYKNYNYQKYNHVNSDKKTGNIDINRKANYGAFNGQECENWRKECIHKTYNNYQAKHVFMNDTTPNSSSTTISTSPDTNIISLSPTSESLLMQRRLSNRLSLSLKNGVNGCIVKSSSLKLANQQQVPTPSG